MLITFFVLATLAWTESSATPFRKVDDSVNGCHKCHPIDNKKINVHLIPHSHNDVGWLKTVDQYYYGMNTSIQQAGVQYIITSVVEALMENSDRRYIQVETAFFWKWWKDQDEEMRKQFKYLVDNGQIEMVNGAWAMNDEACSNYQSTIDQFTLGLRIINETIGQCGIPRVGWQIDAFGHSKEQASLLSKMGYDAVFMTRLDTNDKNQRQNKSALDFLWKGSADLDNDSIFTSIFPTVLFNSPEGYCWDYECADDVIDDDPESRNYNIETKVEQFTKKIKEFANYFPTNNIIIPMGGEFQYEAAEMNFINMDSFIRGFNNNTEINVMYSTPSCYVKAINDSRVNLTSKTGDFFPYSTDDHSYWTGFFTSRPNLKRFERIGHNILQATKQLLALSSFNSTKGNENLRYLREVMGTLQHHNAITGTERQHVADDYVRQLTRGIEHAEMNFGQIVDKLLNSSSSLNISLSSCLLSNISICSVSQESDEFVVVVYNPLAWPVTHYVRIPVEHDEFTIQGPDGNEIFDIIPSISTFDFVSIDGKKPAPFDLVFAAKDVPAMGMKLYHVSKNSTRESAESTPSLESSESAFQVDNHTNLLKSVTLNGKTLGITQNFYCYLSETGVSDKTNVASGAYLFRPTKSSPEPLQGNVTMSRNFTGNLVEEFHQNWHDGNMTIVQSIRWYKDENFIEFDWLVGNISIQDKNGKEIISKFTITDDFDNKNIFYTDSNGREMIQRRKDQRPDYTYNAVTEPVASNYYPVTSKIVIKDEDKNIEIAVLTDRSQGGSSLRKNELELMVHRRTVSDDNVGVGESLNEKEFGTGMYVRGSHFLVIGNAKGSNPDGKSTAAAERILAQKKLVQPLVGLAATSKSFEEMMNISDLSYSALEKAFPENINIITFEPWKDNNTCLLRLEHIMEENEDSDLSDEKIFDNIKTIFKHFDITDVQETTLAANILLEDQVKRPKYSWQSEKLTSMRNGKMAEESSEVPVSLKPMDIKTFIVKLGKKQETNTAGAIKKPVLLIVLVISILIAKF